MFLVNSSTFLNLGFWKILKERPLEIIGSDISTVGWISLEVIYFWSLPSIQRISEPFELLIVLLSVVKFNAVLKDDMPDMFILFDEAILLELWYIVDSMTSDELFFKTEI